MKSPLRLRTPERKQVEMIVECLDDTIGEKHRVRTVWEIVSKLDLSLIESSIKAREGVVGRDATSPRLLFALWLYATIRGVGSARELSRLCTESRPYRWLCGKISVNYHMLSDFRVDHALVLDKVFTQLIAVLVQKKLVTVKRISQDGTRVRSSAGTKSYRRKASLEKLLVEAKEQVENVKALLTDPVKSAEMSSRKKAAQIRARREQVERIEQALAKIPQLEQRQERLKKKRTAQQKEQLERNCAPRASTTDSEVVKMKMPDSGTRSAVNFQFAVDTESRAIVGVDVTANGYDANQLIPMRKQVEERTGLQVKEHLADGGYMTLEDVEVADEQGVSLYVPPKKRRLPEKNGDEFTPTKNEKAFIAKWRIRMGSEEGKEIYKERASTVETVNADLKNNRGLTKIGVRGLTKARAIGYWAAIAYNVVHFGEQFV
jgi:transposase